MPSVPAEVQEGYYYLFIDAYHSAPDFLTCLSLNTWISPVRFHVGISSDTRRAASKPLTSDTLLFPGLVSICTAAASWGYPVPSRVRGAAGAGSYDVDFLGRRLGPSAYSYRSSF